MDRGVLWATVDGVTKSQTQLSNFHFQVIPVNGIDLVNQLFSTFCVFYNPCVVYKNKHLRKFGYCERKINME